MPIDSNIMDSSSPWEIGFGGLPDPSDPLSNVDVLRQIVESAELHHNNAEQAIRELISDCLGDCQTLSTNCVDCVTGAIIRKLDDAEKLSTKADDKVYASILQAIGQAEQATNNVLQIADIIQGNVVVEGVPIGESGSESEAVSGPTQHELEGIAFQAGSDYRNGIVSTPIFSDVADDTIITVNNPIGTAPPSGTVTFPINPPISQPTGTAKIPDGCHCPVGSSWSAIIDANGNAIWACRYPSGKVADLVCDTEPTQPMPEGKCVEIRTKFPECKDMAILCHNGKPLSKSEIMEWCFLYSVGCGGSVCADQFYNPETPTIPFDGNADLTCSEDVQGGIELEPSGAVQPQTDQTLSFPGLLVPIGGPFSPAIPETDKLPIDKCGWPNQNQPPPEPSHGSTITFDYCSPKSWEKGGEEQTEINETFKAVCDDYSPFALWTVSQFYHKLSSGQEKAGYLQKAFIFLGSIAVAVLMIVPCVVVSAIKLVIPLPENCKNASGIGTQITRSLFQFFGRFLQILPDQWTNAIIHISNFNCQTELPQANDLTQARLAGKLKQEEWEFGMKLHGICLDWAQPVLDAGRPFIPANTIFGWCRAGLIDNEEEKNLLKRVALEDETQISNFRFASEAIPPYQDLIRLMVRDVFDDEIAEKYRTDDDFDKKFTGQAKEWAGRQNITEDIFKKQWRSHWQLPSDGQFFEMLHRLRPEKGLVDSLDNPLGVTKEDITEALKINDVMPFWIDRLTAISYRPLGIRQIARAYETNSITANDAKGFYQDIGYEEKDAKILCQYLTVDSAERRAKFLGRPLPSVLEKAFIAGELSEDSYKANLKQAGLPDEIIEERVAYARAKAAIADATEIYKAIRKQFLIGKVNDEEYKQKLLREGFDGERVNEIVRRDNEVKTSRNKEIAVGKMCKLVEQGLLSPQDYFTRAVNLGYKVEDATLLVRSCVAEVQEALRKKVESAIEKAAAAAAKAEALAERARKAREAKLKELAPCKPKPKPFCPV